MKTFLFHLASPKAQERMDDVISLIARDDSGSFGILAGAFRRLTVLSYGLVTVKRANGTIEYFGVAGGVFSFSGKEARIATTLYVRSKDFLEIPALLEASMKREEEGVQEIKESLRTLDFEMMKRLALIGQVISP